ncbi:putative phosphoribosyltransferase [Tamaricihabitans halophyticus]|uniref:Putative phosphoribosyltransferase n=1 Tax=Tamaricihabitans halophyticus TaxID=1262583 RepID=A0A4R2QL87_9PSEU|nr:phosphoribosyltransferase family protein [Tamaricihabitans halophyticus]TCP50117.1 putative phosphoribosyltransferase [Tamaricihabitans halophyticus]
MRRDRKNFRFDNRTEAGAALAVVLTNRAWSSPVVLGLARGGVPVAAPIAEALGAKLDVLVVRKIGAPRQPEYGLGAVTADGVCQYDTAALRALGLTEEDLRPIHDREQLEARRRAQVYKGRNGPPEVHGCDVLIVDDGLATGITAAVAVRAVRKTGAAHVIVAAPVGAPAALARLTEADAVYCLARPANFRAVGEWYRDFDQVSDNQVRRWLRPEGG